MINKYEYTGTVLNLEYRRYFEDIHHIDVRNNRNYNERSCIPGYAPESSRHNIKTLVNENQKIFAVVETSFYHYFMDFLGSILTVISTIPITQRESVEVCLDTFHINKEKLNDISYINFVFSLLDFLKIKYTIIPDESLGYINTNKFTICNGCGTTQAVKNVYYYLKKYLRLGLQEPTKKVFISRNTARKNSGDRIDEENIEQLFLDLGFEIVNPDNFKNIKEQIRFFDQVKILAGVSGSGLTNALFMQPNSTVIEIVTPLSLKRDGLGETDELHHFYKIIAYEKGHLLINIPNHDKITATVKSIMDKTLLQ